MPAGPAGCDGCTKRMVSSWHQTRFQSHGIPPTKWSRSFSQAWASCLSIADPSTPVAELSLRTAALQ